MKRILAILSLVTLLIHCKQDDTPATPAVDPVNCTNSGGSQTNSDGSGVFVPGLFTPNKDGINDVYGPIGTSISSLSTTIYQGDVIVFQSNALDAKWDGSVNGKEAQEGRYRVLLSGSFAQNRPLSYQTYVNLIRECKGKTLLDCTTGDQFTSRGFITGSVSSDPSVRCP
ncbi:hypothetical protein GCM10028805_52140 [Spirosoma harenae]